MRLAVILAVLSPACAYGHAQLESATPAVGSIVASAPAELHLSFSESLEPRFSKIVVTSASGASVNAGAIHTEPGNAEHVLVPVQKLTSGTYTVTWHAVSVDTHRTQGSYRFTIAP